MNNSHILLVAVTTAQIMLLVIAAMTSSYAYALTIISTWGSRGSGNGQFNSPSGMDLDFKGHLYVVDRANNRIQEFNATDGKFISKWGSSGSGPGQFNYPTGIAVDLGTGNVYVSDTGNNHIDKFTPDGKFITSFGSFGTGEGQFVNPSRLDVDGRGNVYV